MFKLIYFLFKAIFFKKKVYTLTFVKEHDGNWYADIPGWPKKYHKNTEMVFGSDTFLEYLSKGRNSVTLKISKHYIDGAYELDLIDKVWYNGAFYQVYDPLIEVYTCPVTLFFLGEYPKKIYLKRVSNR